MSLSEKAIEALKAVREAIAIDPKSFDMDSWCNVSACGTTLCIAGHLAVYVGANVRRERASTRGGEGAFEYCGFLYSMREILEAKLGVNSIATLLDLFYVQHWPSHLAVLCKSGERVRAGQLAIDWFIERYSTAVSPCGDTHDRITQ